MTPDESINFVTGAKSEALLVQGCLFPCSIFQLYIGNIHRSTPSLFIYQSSSYIYKVAYCKFIYKGSTITLQK